MKMIQILVFLICLQFMTSQDLVNLPPGKVPANWDITGEKWTYNSNKGIYQACRQDSDTQDILHTGAWPTEEARRVILTVQTEIVGSCQVNVTNNTDCQIRLSMGKVTNITTKEPNYEQNVTSFPSNTFFNATTGYTRTDTFSIENVTLAASLHFRFEITKFCGRVWKIDLGYYACPEVSERLVNFNKTSAPDVHENFIEVDGTCTKNAAREEASSIPHIKCWFNGTYDITGRCVCDAGYEKTEKQCTACAFGFYKPTKGNVKCSKCGDNSKNGETASTTCSCKDGFYKALDQLDKVDADCYAPPGGPTNIQVSNILPYQVFVQWIASTPGTSKLGVYIVKCTNCPSANIININTTNNNITLTNLAAFANYSMAITNENNVTVQTGKKNTKSFLFTTAQGAPTIIQTPKHETLSDGSVQFTWTPPFGQGGENIVYVVAYGDTTLRLQTTTFTIETDTQDREYTVKIHVEVNVNGQIQRSPIYTTNVKVNGGIPLGIALAVAFGVMIFVVFALVAAFCFWKRRNPAYLQVVRMADGTVKLPAHFYSSGKVYVDPKTYPDVDDAVIEFAFEIEQDELKLGEKIGDGEFADVYKGVLFRSGKDYQVAVKMLKPNSTKEDRADFLSEAAILGQFSDPNVIFLQGVILKEQPNAIILEYMINGSLDNYLQDHDMQFTTIELLEMGRGIASGMKYLSELGFIHRDLAARNVLVDENRICKIADFGMSLEIKMDDAAESLSGKIPVRWTAPEAIQFKKFTTASDVWSYGIVLWEIMAYGERPYWDWTNYEVLEKVSSGYRLPPPMSCPGVVHDLMLQCWTKDRTKRPLFSIIRDRLDMWIRHPDLLEGSTIIELDDNLDYTIMQTINKWLEAIGMGRYAKNFIEQGFATPRQILLLTHDDLERLGIGALDHRKRILKAIQNTRAQVEDQMVRTSSVVGNPNAV